MNKKWSKKGSLNLSIEAIVVVVIAFVVLGLGLGFVRNQFKSVSETAGSVQEQIRQQILEDLRTGNKKLSFPATSINIASRDTTDIAVGVKNTKSQGQLTYGLKSVLQCKQGMDCTDPYTGDDVTFFYDSTTTYTLAQTEANVHPIRITGKGAKGTYLIKLQVLDKDPATTEPIYAEKTFFVTIT